MKIPSAPLKSKYFSGMGDFDVVKWDVLNTKEGEIFNIDFESVSSKFRQGLWLSCDGGIEIDGATYPHVTLWENSAPSRVQFICHTKEGLLHIYNVWDHGRGRESQAWMSGMRIEHIDGGYRYRCTDAGPDINFDALVFSLRRVG